jgi:ribosomal protein S18 acetylase RimI-like enzyme
MNEQRSGRPDIVVRSLAADDWQQARAARLAALADAPYAFSSSLAKEQAYGEELWRRRAGSGRTFGAFDGPRIIGLATGIPADELDGPGTPGIATPGAATPGAATPGAATSGASTSGASTSGASTSSAATRGAATPGVDVDGDRPRTGPPEWHLVGMWVAPDYRGHGVADRLVEAVCNRARQADAAAVMLWVTEINDRAIALYRRHGFSPTGVRELVRPEEPDHWEMQLECRLS